MHHGYNNDHHDCFSLLWSRYRGEFACGKWEEERGKRKKERASGSCLSPLFLPSSTTTTTCYNAWSHDEINLSRPQTRLKVYPPTLYPDVRFRRPSLPKERKEIRSLGPNWNADLRAPSKFCRHPAVKSSCRHILAC